MAEPGTEKGSGEELRVVARKETADLSPSRPNIGENNGKEEEGGGKLGPPTPVFTSKKKNNAQLVRIQRGGKRGVFRHGKGKKKYRGWYRGARQHGLREILWSRERGLHSK